MPPPDQPVEVLLANNSGWTGLNFVTMTQERVRSRLRTLIPTFVPALIQVFPQAHAEQSLLNRRPTLYVRINESYSGYYTPAKTWLVRLHEGKDDRQLRITSGVDVLKMKSRFPEAVAVASHALSGNAFWIRPQKPLAPGEYMIVFGTAGGSGFDLEIQ